MRTTLTIDDDVAAQLEKLRREKKLTLRDAVNDALRRGLAAGQKPSPRPRFETPTANLGKLLIPSIDCYGEVLDFLEEQERK
jgi:hypothetical protein